MRVEQSPITLEEPRQLASPERAPVLVVGDCALSIALLMSRAWSTLPFSGGGPAGPVSSNSSFQTLMSSRGMVHCSPSDLEINSSLLTHPSVLDHQSANHLHLHFVHVEEAGSTLQLSKHFSLAFRVQNIVLSVLSDRHVDILDVLRRGLFSLSNALESSGTLYLLLSAEQSPDWLEMLTQLTAGVGLVFTRQERPNLVCEPGTTKVPGCDRDSDDRRFENGVVYHLAKSLGEGQSGNETAKSQATNVVITTLEPDDGPRDGPVCYTSGHGVEAPPPALSTTTRPTTPTTTSNSTPTSVPTTTLSTKPTTTLTTMHSLFMGDCALSLSLFRLGTASQSFLCSSLLKPSRCTVHCAPSALEWSCPLETLPCTTSYQTSGHLRLHRDVHPCTLSTAFPPPLLFHEVVVSVMFDSTSEDGVVDILAKVMCSVESVIAEEGIVWLLFNKQESGWVNLLEGQDHFVDQLKTKGMDYGFTFLRTEEPMFERYEGCHRLISDELTAFRGGLVVVFEKQHARRSTQRRERDEAVMARQREETKRTPSSVDEKHGRFNRASTIQMQNAARLFRQFKDRESVAARSNRYEPSTYQYVPSLSRHPHH